MPGMFSAKQCLEEFAEACILGSAVFPAAEFEALVPLRRRLEVLTIAPLVAHPVVGRALFRVFEHAVRLADLLEAWLRVVEFAQVRVIFASELAIRPLDIVLRRAARQSQHFVIVFVFHIEGL